MAGAQAAERLPTKSMGLRSSGPLGTPLLDFPAGGARILVSRQSPRGLAAKPCS